MDGLVVGSVLGGLVGGSVMGGLVIMLRHREKNIFLLFVWQKIHIRSMFPKGCTISHCSFNRIYFI